jgi:hypothetical protein
MPVNVPPKALRTLPVRSILAIPSSQGRLRGACEDLNLQGRNRTGAENLCDGHVTGQGWAKPAPRPGGQILLTIRLAPLTNLKFCSLSVLCSDQVIRSCEEGRIK